MSSVMKYKDYIGSVEFSEEDQIFYGKVLGIHSLISYEGESAKELIQDFHEAVDDYLELCAEKEQSRKKPTKALSMFESRQIFIVPLLSMPFKME